MLLLGVKLEFSEGLLLLIIKSVQLAYIVIAVIYGVLIAAWLLDCSWRKLIYYVVEHFLVLFEIFLCTLYSLKPVQ